VEETLPLHFVQGQGDIKKSYMAIPLKDLLQKSINKAGVSEQVGAAVVCNEFNKIIQDILDPKLVKRVKAMYVKNKTLTVAVLSSVVGQEIKLYEREILERLEKKVGENIVERIRFLV